MNKTRSEIHDILTDINVRAQIAFALLMIVGLLIYIAFFK